MVRQEKIRVQLVIDKKAKNGGQVKRQRLQMCSEWLMVDGIHAKRARVGGMEFHWWCASLACRPVHETDSRMRCMILELERD